MIAPRPKQPLTVAEPAAATPVASAEKWLGRNDSEKRRLWERLNPRHRKQLRLLARALVLHQLQGRLPEDLRVKLRAALDDFERLATRIAQLMVIIKQRRQ